MIHTENKVVIPEVVLINTIRLGFRVLKNDYVLAANKQKTFLYRLFDTIALERYNFFEQAISLFVTPDNSKEPKFVGVSMGFDAKRVQDPHIHVIAQEESPANDGTGFDEGFVTTFDDVEEEYNQHLTRNFKGNFNLLINGCNENEVTLIYYVLKAILMGTIVDLTDAGLNNVSFRGAGLKLEQMIADRLFMRSLFIGFDYDFNVPSFNPQSYVSEINTNKKLL